MVDELKETLLAGRAEVRELLFRRPRVEQPVLDLNPAMYAGVEVASSPEDEVSQQETHAITWTQ